MILVTGTTGTTGQVIAKQLLQKGEKVRAAVFSSDKAIRTEIKGVDTIELDMNKPANLQEAFRGISKLVLITPSTDAQLEIATKTVNLAKEMGVKYIVNISSPGTNSGSKSTLSDRQRDIEDHIKKSGLDYTFLRPNRSMQSFIHEFSPKDGKLHFPVGDGKVSFIDERDVANVAFRVLTEDGYAGKSYDLTGPNALGMDEVAKNISDASGRKIYFEDISVDEARRGHQYSSLPNSMVDPMLELHSDYWKNGKASKVTSYVENITKTTPITFESFTKDYSVELKKICYPREKEITQGPSL